MSRNKGIVILSCCAILAGAALLASYLVSSHQQKQLEKQQQQFISDVTQYVNIIYKDFTALEDDISRRILLYNVLIDYYGEYKGSEVESAELDRLFDLVLSNMVNAFTITYNEMVGNVSALASKKMSERQEYVQNERTGIDEAYKRFATLGVGVGGNDVPRTDGGRQEKAELFRELSHAQAVFSGDRYLTDSGDELNSYIESLEGIKALIDADGVIAGTTQEQKIFNDINRLLDLCRRELENKDYDSIREKYETILETMMTWFTVYYTATVDDISGRQRADANDEETVSGQIDDLLALKKDILADKVFGDDWFLLDDIDDLVEEYNQELAEIAERKEKEDRDSTAGIDGGNAGNTDNTGSPSVGNSDELANIGTFAAEVLRLTNIERENNGLPPLTNDNALLTSSAITRAIEIMTSFSHTRPDGRSCFTVYTDAGGRYNSLGENIAYGYTTPEDVVQAWMESAGHRENILRPDFTQLGVGVIKDGRGTYHWAQMFCG